MAPDLSWQPSLFGADEPSFDRLFSGVNRRVLGEGAWLDVQPGWVRGADELFDVLLALTPWRQRDIWMYERRRPKPRLTHRWVLEETRPPLPLLVDMAAALSERYGVVFTQVGANLYRDGADSVAWHGDRREPPPGPRGPARNGRYLPAHLGPLHPQGAPYRTPHERAVPPRLSPLRAHPRRQRTTPTPVQKH